MSNFSTLSEFLLDAGTQYHVFDLGRGIRPFQVQQFLEIEQNKALYPFPRLGCAWIGVVYWSKQLSTQHYIWFIKLPIDEAGFLQQASRNHFLSIIVEALGQNLDDSETQSKLPDHPYSFQPSPQQMADFNAISRQAIGLPINESAQQMVSYVNSPAVIDWQSLPMQAVSDYCLLLNETIYSKSITSNFTRLHPQVIRTLCGCLENHKVNDALSTTILNWYDNNKQDKLIVALALRALSQSVATDKVRTLIVNLLNEELDDSILTIIAARHWHYLNDVALLERFFESCLRIHITLFEGLVKDLVRLPETRRFVQLIMASKTISRPLSSAFAQLASNLKSA